MDHAPPCTAKTTGAHISLLFSLRLSTTESNMYIPCLSLSCTASAPCSAQSPSFGRYLCIRSAKRPHCARA
eukprot:s5140_g2.t1